MIIVLKSRASDGEIADVERRITAMGYRPHTIRGQLRTVIGAIGDDRGKERLRSLESLESVESVTPILQPFKLASREVRSANSVVRVGDVAIGGPKVVVMAGPCSVESREQVLQVAARVKAAGATVLRGGAFKPRTSPYAFQGLEEEGLKLLAEARRETGLPIITEVMEPDKVDVVAEHADILQIGARNVQNFSLLRKVGAAGKPVLLKRGMSTSIQEWLLSAEYVLSGGNPNVILCERGIRTFETATRNTFDISAIPVVKKLSHLPVIADPSHGAGRRGRCATLSGPFGLRQLDEQRLATLDHIGICGRPHEQHDGQEEQVKADRHPDRDGERTPADAPGDVHTHLRRL